MRTPESIIAHYKSLRRPPGVELTIDYIGPGFRPHREACVDLVVEVAELQPDASLGFVSQDHKVPVILSDIMTFDLRGTPDAERSNDRQVFLLFSRLADHQLCEWLVLPNGRYLKPPHERDFHKVIGKEAA